MCFGIGRERHTRQVQSGRGGTLCNPVSLPFLFLIRAGRRAHPIFDQELHQRRSGESATHESLQPNRRKRRKKKATEKKNIRIIDDDDDEHVSNAGWLL